MIISQPVICITSKFPTKATGIVLNQNGHSVFDVRITIIENIKTSGAIAVSGAAI